MRTNGLWRYRVGSAMHKTVLGGAVALMSLAPLHSSASAILIDGTGTGAPTVTSTSPLFVGATFTPYLSGWFISMTVQGDHLSDTSGQFGFQLFDPITNSLSDSFTYVSVGEPANQTIINVTLFSDDDPGGIIPPNAFCPGPQCRTAVEDGSFQLAYSSVRTSLDSFDILLRSSPTVPEPGSLALVGLALLGVSATQRRK